MQIEATAVAIEARPLRARDLQRSEFPGDRHEVSTQLSAKLVPTALPMKFVGTTRTAANETGQT